MAGQYKPPQVDSSVPIPGKAIIDAIALTDIKIIPEQILSQTVPLKGTVLKDEVEITQMPDNYMTVSQLTYQVSYSLYGQISYKTNVRSIAHTPLTVVYG